MFSLRVFELISLQARYTMIESRRHRGSRRELLISLAEEGYHYQPRRHSTLAEQESSTSDQTHGVTENLPDAHTPVSMATHSNSIPC